MTTNDIHPPRAYRDPDFMNSPAGRPLRILSEYLEPQERFEEQNIEDTILFFGSARLLPRAEAEKRLEAAEAGGGDLAKAKVDLKMSRYYEDTRQLAFRLTEWSKELADKGRRFVVCSGGGPGIMEAANRGARDADGQSVALGISLPFEQGVNEYACPDLSFEFHYFFVRKFYFLYHAKALVVFPGGFGTMDELFESLTLIQTGKLDKKLPIILYDKEFWNDIIDFDQFVRWGVISPDDLNLFSFADNVDEAFSQVVEGLQAYHL